MRGLSIIETVISVFILSMLTILLFNLYPGSVLAARQAEQKQRADRLAQSHLSEVMNRPFSSLPVGYQEHLLPDQTLSGITYVATLNVDALPNGEDPAVARALRVKVEWQERSKNREVTHEIWIAKIPR